MNHGHVVDKGRLLGVAVVAISAACTTDAGPTVTVHARGTQLIVSEDGQDRWKPVVLDATGIGSFEFASGTYGLAWFCPDRYAQFFFDTEPDEFDLTCAQVIEQPINVSGTTTPGATVWIEGSDVAAANGAYAMKVSAGTHDVFALSATRILTRRSVDISADLVLDLPLATEGVELRAVTPIVVGADPSSVSISADMNPPNTTTISLGRDPTTVHVPPSSVLVESDHAAIVASTSECAVQQELTDATPAFELPGPYSATVDRGRVTWTADSRVPWERTQIYLRNLTGLDFITVRFVATTAWLTAMGRGDSMPIIDTKRLPGWTPALAGFATGDPVSYDIVTARGRYDRDYAECRVNGNFTW